MKILNYIEHIESLELCGPGGGRGQVSLDRDHRSGLYPLPRSHGQKKAENSSCVLSRFFQTAVVGLQVVRNSFSQSGDKSSQPKNNIK